MNVIHNIIKREGGYVNHPADKGGPTNKGITLKTLSEWLDREATIEDLKKLDYADVYNIYEKKYFLKPGFDKLSIPKLQELATDIAVLHGQSRAIRWMQEVCNEMFNSYLVTDGVLGPKTISVVHAKYCSAFYAAYLAKRYEFVADIVATDPSQRVFLRGWINRCNEFLRDLGRM
jgi:lysozyme family protein